jgi:formate C-acetyltransferase
MDIKNNAGWNGFVEGPWTKDIDVRDFIQRNYTLYEGNDEFLVGPTDNTTQLWNQCMELTKLEIQKGGVLDMDTSIISTITSHGPGYLNKDIETIVGFQTNEPFKRSLQPNGGIKMAQAACKSYGYEVEEEVVKIYTDYRKTHNQGVFDAYDENMRMARKSGIITGLPDAYGRGRIIGDYRRVALYGVDNLILQKQNFLKNTSNTMDDKNIRNREETNEQIRALNGLKTMALSYGFDISKPATNSIEAIQWLYFGYLAAVKDQNGAAMSLGRTSTFLDIYINRDLENKTITETQAQEYIDHFIMKLRLVKFARTPDYNEIFAGDPTWVTESLAGVGLDGRPLVTKTSFRYLWTLSNIGTAPEPNMTVLWSVNLPQNFKDYCARMSIMTSAIQYENDDLMRMTHGDDYAIACCVSPMKVGKQMQFFGARANLAKCLLYTINGGIDEKLKLQVSPKFVPITSEYLDYDEVMDKYTQMMEWLAELYVNTLNVIHYMHDKYAYEAIEMALHDNSVHRFFATGIAGLSVVADSLSAIKYAKVKPIRDEDGVAIDYEITGDYPKYGNNDDRVDEIAVELVKKFMTMIRKHHTYREAEPTMSILTITSNVVYGKKTGNTPDGRRAGEPFAPGANPMHGRDTNGAMASLASVSKLPFSYAADGISNTFSVIPNALGKSDSMKADNLEFDASDLGMTIEEVRALAESECGNSACAIPNLEVE